MMPDNAIRRVGVDADLSEVSLDDAYNLLGRPVVAQLIISPSQYLYALRLIHPLIAGWPVRIEQDSSYTDNEWALAGNGNTFWSPGA